MKRGWPNRREDARKALAEAFASRADGASAPLVSQGVRSERAPRIDERRWLRDDRRRP